MAYQPLYPYIYSLANSPRSFGVYSGVYGSVYSGVYGVVYSGVYGAHHVVVAPCTFLCKEVSSQLEWYIEH